MGRGKSGTGARAGRTNPGAIAAGAGAQAAAGTGGASLPKRTVEFLRSGARLRGEELTKAAQALANGTIRQQRLALFEVDDQDTAFVTILGAGSANGQLTMTVRAARQYLYDFGQENSLFEIIPARPMDKIPLGRIRVDEDDYRMTYGKSPRGQGLWEFSARRAGRTAVENFNTTGSYPDAARRAKQWAQKIGFESIKLEP